MKFSSDVPGYVTALRFFKGRRAAGTHIGHLWTSEGQQLVEARYTAETESGWQEVAIPRVQIKANTTYVVSCHFEAHAGYVQDVDYFSYSGVHNFPLHALENGADGANGVYEYDPPDGNGGFPTKSVGSSNYLIDLVFSSLP